MNRLLVIGCILLNSFGFAQESVSTLVIDMRDSLTLYSDFGYSSAPIRIRYDFNEEIQRVHFRNNFSPSIGVGLAYKWFNLRLNFALNNTKRAVSRYGNTRYVDIGAGFQIKQVYSEVGITVYRGFALEDAYRWNDTLNLLKPNLILPNAGSFSLAINTWVFQNKDFKMAANYGRSSYFSKPVSTVYFKPTVAIHGFGGGGQELFPEELRDSSNSITLARNLTALEAGLVPGYAKVWKYGAWQASVFGGLGAVIQIKSFATSEFSQGFLGLAPRYDLRMVVGHFTPKHFVTLTSEIDSRNIRITGMSSRQVHYSIRLTGGIRL